MIFWDNFPVSLQFLSLPLSNSLYLAHLPVQPCQRPDCEYFWVECTLFIACVFSSYHNEAFYLDLVLCCSVMVRCDGRRILQLVTCSKEANIMSSGLYDNLKNNAHHSQRLQPADVQLQQMESNNELSTTPLEAPA